MHIIAGMKQVEQVRGMVADFCPICREVRAFQLIRIGLVSHIYYVSSGAGTLAGYVIRCNECGLRLKTDSDRYAATEKDSRVGIEALVRDTFPKLREVYAARLEVETRVKQNPQSLSADERKYILMEPFTLLNHLVERRFANYTELDKESSLACLGTVLVVVGFMFASWAFPRQIQEILLSSAIFFGIGTVYTVNQLYLGPRRFFMAQVLPPLVKALKPLKPTREEVAACIDRCKTQHLKISKVAKLDVVWARLERSLAGFDA
jgi:hypothetical protein